jgi:hypothetical protein
MTTSRMKFRIWVFFLNSIRMYFISGVQRECTSIFIGSFNWTCMQHEQTFNYVMYNSDDNAKQASMESA